ncbi:MAG TPA: NADH-quinone oxidoreductase subunit I [Candidatus Kapabacteria bacterium]|nr:NADH-quinone oxidoreductase subunit I [Candidatus Kapabacteria bacterium]
MSEEHRSKYNNRRQLRKQTFLERLYIAEIVRGLVTSIKHLFRPKFVRQYPEEKWTAPSSFRGRPVLVMEENGAERCVACGLCSRVCPPLAIEVQASETELLKERYPVRFEINMLRCIFCGFCEEVCPEEAIIMSKDYELTFTKYSDAIYGKDKLLTPKAQLTDRLEFLKQMRNS